jgi:hypothetical protein
MSSAEMFWRFAAKVLGVVLGVVVGLTVLCWIHRNHGGESECRRTKRPE